MKKLALMAGACLFALGSVGSAEAQRFGYDDGWGQSRRVVRERIVVRRAPVIRQRVVYRQAPVIRQRVVYRQAPVVRQRVVYRQAPAVRQRVVVRQAPTIRQRVAYQQPRARLIYGQPAYSTRVSFRQNQQRDRVVIRNRERRDVISTGSIRNRGEMRQDMRMERRMMQD